MAEKIQAIRGMNDILPDTSHQWLFFEHTVREWLKDYGYKNIRTPIVEDTRLFVRSLVKPPILSKKRCTPSPTASMATA